MNKTIITVATTGSWPTRTDNPHIPMTPTEIADDVYRCWQAGAAIAHLHMRDEAGMPTMRLDLFEEAVTLIRKKCDIIINLTTSGDDYADNQQRQAHLIKLHPEMASYDAGTMNWQHRGLFVNHPAFLEELGMTMQREGVKPEVEIFDAGMVYNALHYIKEGVLQSPLHFQFVLGAAGGMTATVSNLVYLHSLIPTDSTWSALGIGKGSMPILLATLSMGGHVRVGMEDNVYFQYGQLAQSNEQFVRRAAELIRIKGSRPATPDEAREILNIVK